MKALTLHQPWASLIALGIKTIETRSWSTQYRGRLAVHAGAKRPPTYWHNNADTDVPPAIDLVSMASCWEWTENVDDYTSGGAYRWAGPLGAIVATCDLLDVVPIRGPLGEEEPIPHALVVGNFATDDLALFHEGSPFASGHDDQRPYGDFTAGRFAWLLGDVKPTTERCPFCEGLGYGIVSTKGTWIHGGSDLCPVCDGKGTCPPVPAKGHQRLWEWTP